MSDYSVNSIGPVGNEHSRPAVPPVESHRQAEHPSPEAKSSIPMYTFPGNTRLVFKVDEANNEVVVMIVDEASSEVIRTVPGDAMKDIPSGGLIQKSA